MIQARPRTQIFDIRISAIRQVLLAIEATLRTVATIDGYPTQILIRGSASLALNDPGFPRVPADLDLAVPSVGFFDAIGTVACRSQSKMIDVIYFEQVKFTPGRFVPPTASFVATVIDAQKTEDRFLVEVLADHRMFEGRRSLAGAESILKFQQLEEVLADKYHAYMRRRPSDRRNMRWVDLADLVYILLSPGSELKSSNVRYAKARALALSDTNELYTVAPEPPIEWLAAWRKHRAIELPGLCDLNEAVALFKTFWDTPVSDHLWTTGGWRPEPYTAGPS